MDEKQQENFRMLLTEAIVKLCQMEAVYTDELRIEGTVCVVSDRTSVTVAHFTECVGDIEENDNPQSLFEQCIIDTDELVLPEVKMEHDEIIETFEAGVDVTDSLSVMQDYCQASEKSLITNNTSTTANMKQSTSRQSRYPQRRCHMHLRRQHGDQPTSKKKPVNKSAKQCRAHLPLATDQIYNAECDRRSDANTYVSNYDLIHTYLQDDDADSTVLLESLERKDYQNTTDGTQLLVSDANVTDGAALQQLTETDQHSALQTRCTGSESPQKLKNTQKATIMQYFEKIHLETLDGLYQYKCCLCHKMFKIRSSLYGHINSHAGRRRYACKHCGDRFVHHSSLHNHVNNKHLVKSHSQANHRYLCTGCDRRFRFCSQFERHIRSNPSHCIEASDKQQ